MTERLLNFYYIDKDFAPCMHCANVFDEECLIKCTPEMKYKHFELRPGTTLEDLGPFPIKDIMKFPDPYFRMVVVAIYLTAITDYELHKEEYEFREKAAGMEKKVPDGFKFIKEVLRHGGTIYDQGADTDHQDQQK